jgi:excisionase family DNA binding protein
MTERIAVPLPDGRWLIMDTETFVAALAAGRAFPPPDLPAPIAMEPLLTSAGVAELLGCNDTLVEQMAKDGRIPAVRIGRLLRFDPEAVLAALRGRAAPHE